MFNNDYKKAMDRITPSDDAINKTLTALNNESQIKRKIPIRRIIRVAAIACVCAALVFTTVMTAFHINDIFGEYSSPEQSQTVSEYIYEDEIENGNGESEKIVINGLKQASNHDEIAELLKNHFENSNRIDVDDFWVEITDRNDAVLEEGVEGGEFKPSTEGKLENLFESPDSVPEHSETNNQVKDVEEADIVKTDGKYIYYSNNKDKKIHIVKINGKDMLEVASVKISEKESLLEMVLFENKLLLITNGYLKDSITYSYYFDITDRANPKEIAKLSQDGYYNTSRTINDIVYIITCHYSHGIYRDDLNGEYYDLIPECNGERIEADNILIPETIDSASFTIITAYDGKDEKKEFKSYLSFLGASDILYATTENIYLTKTIFLNGSTTNAGIYQFTEVYRVSLGNNELVVTGKATVPGNTLNQFSMDEKDGCLRIATNVYRYNYSNDKTHVGSIQYNQVFCLDKDMKIIGESDKLGIDEVIKSVRYIGDIAYVVTFRQTDPLYAVDLSDPKNPVTLSELKIDGFSTYMHPYGSKFLIGIGFDADPRTGWTTGIKVTVFDVSDPKNIFDVCTYTREYGHEIGYIDSPALYDHKAVFIDYKKQIIAIPLTRQQKDVIPSSTPGVNTFRYERETVYMFLDFDGKDIKEKVFVDLFSDELKYEERVRALYIGNYSFVVNENGIACMDLEKYEVVSKLNFE